MHRCWLELYILMRRCPISRVISYHIISYHTISYHITSYHIISYHIISYHIISYHIITLVSKMTFFESSGDRFFDPNDCRLSLRKGSRNFLRSLLTDFFRGPKMVQNGKIWSKRVKKNLKKNGKNMFLRSATWGLWPIKFWLRLDSPQKRTTWLTVQSWP